MEPISGEIAPFDPIAVVRARIAFAAARRVMDVQKEFAEQIVALLAPAAGTRFDRRA